MKGSRSVSGWKLWPEYLGAALLLPFAAVFLFLLFEEAAKGQWPTVLLLVPLCLWFLTVGILGFLRCLMTAHFVPEGIAFTLGNRTVRQIPARQLGMFFCLRSAGQRSIAWTLGVSTYRPESLVQLQLKQSPLDRQDQALMRHNAQWQKQLQQKYLTRRCYILPFTPWKWDILPFRLDKELLYCLHETYPQVPGILFELEPGLPAEPDSDPASFTCAPKSYLSEMRGSQILMTVLLVGLSIGFFLSKVTNAWAMIPVSLAAYWVLEIDLRPARDRVSLTPEGIRVMRGEKERTFIPSSQLGVILYTDGDPSDPILYRAGKAVLIPRQLLEEPAEGEMSLARKLQLNRQFRKRRAEVPVFSGLEGRMQMLRQLYPQVPVVHTGLFYLFSQLFPKGDL